MDNILIDYISENNEVIECKLTNNVLKLKQKYPEEQLWFSFVHAIYRTEPKKYDLPAVSKTIIQKYVDEIYYTPQLLNETSLLFQEGVEQISLPFKETQLLTDKEICMAAKTNFPGWEKKEGKPFKLKINKHHQYVREYLKENCRGHFAFKFRTIWFERKNDYVMSLLKFSE
jgi:hypothetical protein